MREPGNLARGRGKDEKAMLPKELRKFFWNLTPRQSAKRNLARMPVNLFECRSMLSVTARGSMARRVCLALVGLPDP